ncbi:hypothetical protein QJS10_CPA08g00994 [Acorus calamus]|uniref:Uncharacterized protein n=1 Tax=Acorus calamus TaxID=4465 RepID=A0AAV9EF22_ACOCL|nr:hypothetical protein QJS10_CPA08g00994 [Acorus calamus]
MKRIIRDVIRGLGHAHSLGITHGLLDENDIDGIFTTIFDSDKEFFEKNLVIKHLQVGWLAVELL